MIRSFATLAVGFVLTAAVHAHFVYVVPDADGTTAKVIFSDSLEPDTNVNIEKIAHTKLFVVADGGKPKPIDWTLNKEGGFYSVNVPGTGTRTVGGTTDYGVIERGGATFRLVYHPKAIVGPVAGVEKPSLGSPLEITATVLDGKLHFQVFRDGNPLPEATLDVMAPGAEKSTVVKTNDQGLCPGTNKKGTYAARVKYEIKTAGEHQGKKFDSTRHYATIVVDWK